MNILHRVDESKADNIIICVDEPELHLHAHIHKKIPEFFGKIITDNPNKNIQFFVSTHSPFIISSAGVLDDQKVYMIKNGQTCDLAGTEDKKQNGFHRDIKQASFKLLGGSMTDLISNINVNGYTACNILYCEGKDFDSDAKYYQKMFPSFKEVPNIWVSVGGATDVIKYYYLGKEVCHLAFGQPVKILGLIDRSCSGGRGIYVGEEYNDGYIKTDGESLFSSQDLEAFYKHYKTENLIILERRELENYLYDIAVIEKACTILKSGDNPEILRGIRDQLKDDNNFMQEVQAGEVKDKYRDLLSSHKAILAEAFGMLKGKAIYKNLQKEIFLS